MMLRSNGKPPLARSPIRLRSRRKPLQPTLNSTTHTPPGSLTKSQLPNRNWEVEKSELRPEYHTISCELRALAKIVNQEIGGKDGNKFDEVAIGGQRSPLFERGRFYDEYSARRNERLKRKKGETEGYEKKHVYDLGVRVESAKKRDPGKFDSRRKTVVAAATPVAERREGRTPRYLLRSGAVKENKKPPLPMMMNVEKSVGVSERKVGVRRIRKT
ncbi:hypothetical protein BUALT_Bualt08G0013700 [Buddleja alternifolia]|uniref:Uncharacterized protein n=1 Tax=Buddleja alternifolia TaxID=168488 RepID=A0AAV6XDS9_9LAMI|nr:hypothetical protein BUALT_Bualt08G0013700 [Buddleja alternifolia]